MNRQRIISAGGKGRPGYASAGASTFITLSDAPGTYAGQGGKVVVVKITENGLEFNTEAAIDRHDVKTDSLDTNPQFLDYKIQGGAGLIVAVAYASDHLNLTTVVNPFLAWGNPIISFYDNTLAIPVGPSDGNRYIALVTANGWYKDHVYEYHTTGAVWQDIPPVTGAVLFDKNTLVSYNWNGTIWEKNIVDSDSRLTDDRYPTTHAASHDVNGSDELFQVFYKDVISCYNNVPALPVGPAIEDRYVAGFTNVGWTAGHIYEWDGSIWVETIPVQDRCILVRGNSAASMVGGGIYKWTGATWAITKYGTLIIDSTDGSGSGYLADKLGSGDGGTVYTIPATSRIWFGARVDGATVDLVGVSPNKTIAVKLLGITDAYVAVANKDGTAATPSMRTIGTGALQACAGNDSRLSDSRTPTAHSFGGALHSQDSIANVQGRLSSGKFLTTAAAEISTITEKTALVGNDLIVIEDSADSNNKKRVKISNTLGNIVVKEKTYINSSGIAVAVNIIAFRATTAMTLTKMYVYRVGGTGATVNARKNGVSNHLAAAFSVSSADTWMDSGVNQNLSYAAGDKGEVMIVTATGSPTQLAFSLEFTRV